MEQKEPAATHSQVGKSGGPGRGQAASEVQCDEGEITKVLQRLESSGEASQVGRHAQFATLI